MGFLLGTREVLTLLKACAKKKDLEAGFSIHDSILQRGLFDMDTYVASSLISMYAKCGAIAEAEKVFQEVPDRNLVCWNSLISGYVQHGMWNQAVDSFEKMQSIAGLSPDDVSFICILKACGGTGNINKGKQIHEEVLRTGHLRINVMLGTALVDLYAKCGKLEQSEKVLDGLHVRDTVSWNTLIAGYIHNDLSMEALRCFTLMQEDGISPDAITFIYILKACGSIHDVDRGRQIHDEIINKHLLYENVVLGTSLVDMYVKCGELSNAVLVLYDLTARNEVTWNAVIVGYAQKGLWDDALTCVKKMEREAYFPNSVTYISLLSVCSSTRAIEKGNLIHDKVVKEGLFGKDVVLGTALVDMYAKCGMLLKAQQVLDVLPIRNVVSWNALISGYAQKGQGEEAINCFNCMQGEGLSPNNVTYISILKACGCVRALDKGQQLHNEIISKGFFDKDIVLCNAVVDMYAKCGAFAKAEEVLDAIPVRDIGSWNALIAGYTQVGQDDKALNCYYQMQHDGVCPDSVTFTCILKSCGTTKEIVKGKQIHAEIVANGLLGANLILDTALIDMYVKSGSLAKAKELMVELNVHDVISWNTIIAGYSQQEQYKEILNYIQRMQVEGVLPDAVTLHYILKACSSLGCIDTGIKIHSEILNHPYLKKDVMLRNSLMDMYFKCRELGKAEKVFNELKLRDTVSWNTLTTGYAQLGKVDEAVQCLERMKCLGLSPDVITFSCVLNACGNTGCIEKGKEVHDTIIDRGLLANNIVIATGLVDMYAKCGALKKARQISDELPFRDTISWNALMSAYIRHDQPDEVFCCLEVLQREGIPPNDITFMCVLKACCCIGDLEKGKEIHDQIVNKGFLGKSSMLDTALVDMYAKCGEISKAEAVMNQLPSQSTSSFNSIIAGYISHGLAYEALECFERMKREGLCPDATTFSCLLRVYGSIGSLNEGELIYKEIITKDLLENDVVLGTALVDMYTKCGALVKAEQAFCELTCYNVATWNALIAGYSQHCQIGKALRCLNLMERNGFVPDSVSCLYLLYACNHTGLVGEGETCFVTMSQMNGVIFNLDHYTCIVDLLGRAGQFEKAIALIKNMPSSDYLPLWSAILGACQKMGNVDVGRLAFDQGLMLDPTNTTAYVVMANMYINAGMKQDAENIEAMRVRYALE